MNDPTKCAVYHKQVNRPENEGMGQTHICAEQCPSCIIWYGRDDARDDTRDAART